MERGATALHLPRRLRFMLQWHPLLRDLARVTYYRTLEARLCQAPDSHVPKLWARYGRLYVKALYGRMEQTFLMSRFKRKLCFRFWLCICSSCSAKPQGLLSRRDSIQRPRGGQRSSNFLGRSLRIRVLGNKRPHSDALQIKTRAVACKVPQARFGAAELVRLFPGDVWQRRSASSKALQLG